MRLKTLKFKPIQVEPKTLGEHIKRERLKRGLRQKDAAAHMGVDTFTVLNWEKSRTTPPAAAFPAILAFLGYDPLPAPQDLAERLGEARRARGWSIRAAAAKLGVDPTTFSGWERGKPLRQERHAALIEDFLKEKQR